MRRIILAGLLIGIYIPVLAQEINSLYTEKKIIRTQDTIFIENVSINPEKFSLKDNKGNPIDPKNYSVDYKSGKIIFLKKTTIPDTLIVNYLRYPDFLTKKYTLYSQDRVVANEAGLRYSLPDNRKRFVPFEGLNTSGSITRGVTIGNNQNTTVSSNLDLQITGKISDRVSIRASIQDSNIPLQEGGYSQRLDEFDQIFIELFSDNWDIRAGDLFLENRHSRFLNFNKKVQGLYSHFSFGPENNKTEIFASAALVRGQYARNSFTGQEGIQGPYKLRGNNGELFVLVISGSERVYVNGILKTRGENNDYIIDYNAGEVTFTSLFPVNSEMRIIIEFQYSERSYTRFFTYGGAKHTAEKWSLEGYWYAENDIKNQPLQQNLTSEQVQVLQNAGDDQALMNAPSAFIDTYSENKILYKKVLVNGVEVFEFSNNPDDELYNVRFQLVGNNQGNYVLSNAAAIGKIYQYVEPINGIPQGNYEPTIKLVSPTKLQLATLLGSYSPSEKTNINFELGVSNNDSNLFSSIDDDNNKGLAGKLDFKQRLYSNKWNIDAFGNYQLIQKDFRTVERLFNIEFNRDWNLTTFSGNQSLIVNGIVAQLPEKGKFVLQHENLSFSDSFSGNRWVLLGNLNLKNWTVLQNGSYLQSSSTTANSTFARNQTRVRHHFNKNWIGSSFNLEDNQEKIKSTQLFSALSQRFSEYGIHGGRGDSTKVFVEVGFFHRINDSLQNGLLQRVNHSNSYYLKSRLLKNNTRDLTLFVNYRHLSYTDNSRKSEPSLNSRLVYNDRFFNQLITNTTIYETQSGTLPQQEFTYLEVEPGRGIYMWNDYNNNGIQELEEFEVAPFPDLAKYVRVFLPNQIFIKTHQNKFSQSVVLNPGIWQNESGIKKFLSHFYNQTAFLIDRKIQRTGNNFDLNPFESSNSDLLGLNTSFRNSLYYNRGKQKHSTTYNFTRNNVKSLLSVGSQENKNVTHQVQYLHLVNKTWLFSLSSRTVSNTFVSENYNTRNFEIASYQINPKISYLFNKNTSLDVFYEYQVKENAIGENELLKQNRIGTSFSYASEKSFTINGEFSLFDNQFQGIASSPVGFQMLEGLQPGKNSTWRLLIQKNLTQYLDLNLNYQGRKSENSDTIHTGSVQIRAYF